MKSATITKRIPDAYDYAALKPEVRIVVKQKTGEIRERCTTAAQNIIEIGARLIDVKEQLPHGEFLPWLDAEFEWSIAAATKMMQVAEQFKFVKFTNLTIAPSALYLLAAPSTPPEVREKFVKKAKAGKPVTHAEVKKAIVETKPIADDDIPTGEEPQPMTPPAPVKPTAMPVDKLGEPIPDTEIATIFDRAKQLEDLARRTSDIKCEVERGIKAKDELFGRVGQLTQTAAENLYTRFKAGMPYCVCRYCRGKSRTTGTCMQCQGTGWQTKEEYSRVERALKLGGK